VYPFRLFSQDLLEDGHIVVLGLDLAQLDIDDLSQLVHGVRPGQNLFQDLRRHVLQRTFQRLNRYIALVGLRDLLQYVRGWLPRLRVRWQWTVRTLFFEKLRVRHHSLPRLVAFRRLSIRVDVGVRVVVYDFVPVGVERLLDGRRLRIQSGLALAH